MNVKKKIQDNGIVEFSIMDETHTLLRSLTESLRLNEDIEFVSYVEVHPLKTQFKLLVKSKKNNETELLLETIKYLREEILNKYRDEINKKL